VARHVTRHGLLHSYEAAWRNEQHPLRPQKQTVSTVEQVAYPDEACICQVQLHRLQRGVGARHIRMHLEQCS
jgi:hypothetical protein